MPSKLQHVNRRLNAQERARHAKVRDANMREIPPKRMPADIRGGVAGQIRAERESRQLTWYALAKMAGIPNQATIPRD